MSGGTASGREGVGMRRPYGLRAAAYGDGGSAAGVSGLAGIGQSSPYGDTGGAQYGGLGTASAQGTMSGLARFGGGVGNFQPRAYTPGQYRPALTSLNLRSPAARTPGSTGAVGGGQGDGGGDGGYGGTSTPGDGGFGFGATPGQVGGVIGALGALGGIPGLGGLANVSGISRGISDWGAANNNPNYSHEGLHGPLGGMDGGYGGDSGIGSGPGGADGNAGDAGSSDAGSTGAGGDTGGDPGSGGDGTGSGGDTGSGDGWARGGWVTRDRLRGRNPKGPDDGYGALDVGEFVVPRHIAQPAARALGGK